MAITRPPNDSESLGLDPSGSVSPLDRFVRDLARADPGTAARALAPPALAPGATIGRYLVLELLGRGGMGEVYAAYDPKLDRKVALKLLSAHVRPSDTRDPGARLLREAQALARFAHPHVVTVHDVGVVEDQVFVAMEYLDGGTLRQWLAGERAPEQIVQMFLRAGRGLAAAHAAGIIHRDFKPDNVLLGSDGRVRVADFGLARPAISESGERAALAPAEAALALEGELTRTGTVLGTPAYMAPEQRAGRPVDARADQYSFCVALHEALTGSLPGGAEPRRRLTARWRRVVARGLAEDPRARYPSMDALLADLAYDPAIRWRRALVAMLVASLAALAYLLVRDAQRAQLRVCSGAKLKLAGVWDAAREEVIEKAFLTTRQGFAADTWRRTKSLLDEHASRWVAMHRRACEATVRGEQSARLLDLRMRCLERRRQEVIALTDLFARADAATVRRAITAASSLTSVSECAEAHVLEGGARPPPDRKARDALTPELAKAKALLGAGKYAEGIRLLDPVVSRAKAVGDRTVEAEALLLRAGMESESVGYPAARQSAQDAMNAAMAAGDDRLFARAAIEVTGYVWESSQDSRLWGDLARAAIDRLGEEPALRAHLLYNLGWSSVDHGRFEEALVQAGEALRLLEQSGDRRDPLALRLWNLRGIAYRRLGRHVAQGAELRRAVEWVKKHLGSDHPDLAAPLGNLAEYHIDVDDPAKGLELGKEAYAIVAGVLEDTHPNAAAFELTIGQALRDLGRLEEAEAHLRRSVDLAERAHGRGHHLVGLYLEQLGGVILARGDIQAAAEIFRRVLSMEEKAHGAEDRHIAQALVRIAQVRRAMGRSRDAIPPLRRALAIREKQLSADHETVAESLQELGDALRESGSPAEALALFSRALAIRRKGENPGAIADALTGLGQAHLAMGAPARARPLLEKALEMRRPGVRPMDRAETELGLAHALWASPRDRHRARGLAEAALGRYVQLRGLPREQSKARAWLASHRP
jgi:tetratricopeptide (TPR) repeat protein